MIVHEQVSQLTKSFVQFMKLEKPSVYMCPDNLSQGIMFFMFFVSMQRIMIRPLGGIIPPL